MAEDHAAEIEQLKEQRRSDRKLIERAAQVLAEIDRGTGLRDDQADVLAALRIRLEGKERAKLEDLLAVTGDIGGKKDLGDVLNTSEEKSSEWPEIKEKKKDWPSL
jgi:hypothetical protein